MEKFKVGQCIKRIKSSHSKLDIGDVVYVLKTTNSDSIEVSKTRGGERIPGAFSTDYFEAQGTCGTGPTNRKLLLCQNSK